MRRILVFCAYLALALVFQVMSGAYQADISPDDEPGHYVTGLMVHDYIVSGRLSNPLRFAEEFYIHYPLVALGHWPPVFYAVQGVWDVALGDTRRSLLVMMALLSATAALLLCGWAENEFHPLIAAVIGAVFLATPIVRAHTSVIKAELLLTVFSCLSALSFTAFLRTRSRQHAISFALATSFTILTKGNGWALLLMPPIAAALVGTGRILLCRNMMYAWGIIATLCVPWSVVTLRMVQNGWAEPLSVGFVERAIVFNATAFVRNFGWALTGCGMMGICVAWRHVRTEPSRFRFWACVLALLISVFVFQSLVPASLSDRHLIPALVPALMCVAGGVVWLFNRWPFRLGPAFKGLAAGGSIAALFLIQAKPGPVLTGTLGYRSSVLTALKAVGEHPAVIMTSSEGQGEQVLAAECAVADHRPRHYVVRASKVLTTGNWDSQQYRSNFSNTEQVLALLDAIPVSVVIMDMTPDHRPSQHHHLLVETVQHYPDRFELIATFPNGGHNQPNRIEVYKVLCVDSTKVPHLRLDLSSALGKTLIR
jgi:hypothetical protein